MTPTPHTVLRCPNCDALIGTIYLKNGKSFLDDGQMLVRSGIWNCRICIQPFYFHGEELDDKHRRQRTPEGSGDL